MLTETFVASFLLVCITCFFAVNLHNILKSRKPGTEEKIYAEIEHPSGFTVGLAAAGTLIYFLEALSYMFLVFASLVSVLRDLSFFPQFQFMFLMQVLGLVLTSFGYFFFIWSVIARGKYATSWKMPNSQRLVTWGPYRYVRHSSYLGYFLMFFGLFFLWPNLFTLFPLLAIPGYSRVALQEEKLLVQRFDEEYLEYQRKTGRFMPRF